MGKSIGEKSLRRESRIGHDGVGDIAPRHSACLILSLISGPKNLLCWRLDIQVYQVHMLVRIRDWDKLVDCQHRNDISNPAGG